MPDPDWLDAPRDAVWTVEVLRPGYGWEPYGWSCPSEAVARGGANWLNLLFSPRVPNQYRAVRVGTL